MRVFLLSIAVFFSSFEPVAAQQDPMELQRCIWRCLYNSPGAASAQYNQCVSQYCVAAPLPQNPAPSAWISGVATDGVHRFAMTQGEQGYAFTYFCAPGQSFFVLGGVPVPPDTYRMQIGQTDYIVTLDSTRGVLSAEVAPDNAFTNALRRGGTSLTVRTMQGLSLVRFALQGADGHIGQAIAGCRS